eukprot:CAMPEP_0194393486 /NCGR_PEP_ID=MMETSP0174-20130528/123320_1 /TAXON_ID=216777 /ORGANISM="Proboscia alata, Strain PI-D3" /LENGTH=155 /DNA_ID=CAMNT_0039189167 /DNA_START=36 /DNA_END=503 /DNA_ORIENTATION=-
MCTFCQSSQSCIKIPPRPGTLTTKSLCLMHYYTTRAIRGSSRNSKKSVGGIGTIIQPEFKKQLPSIQKLFSQAFVELKEEISEIISRESMNKELAMKSSDPLGAMLNLGGGSSSAPSGKSARKKTFSARESEKNEAKHGGGFVKKIKRKIVAEVS